MSKIVDIEPLTHTDERPDSPALENLPENDVVEDGEESGNMLEKKPKKDRKPRKPSTDAQKLVLKKRTREG
jgi:hypothetical protein